MFPTCAATELTIEITKEIMARTTAPVASGSVDSFSKNAIIIRMQPKMMGHVYMKMRLQLEDQGGKIGRIGGGNYF